jgi:hypothetical protein
MDETTDAATGGHSGTVTEGGRPVILLGVALGFLAMGIYFVLSEICSQLQELNHCLSRVFLTFPLSLQEYKDLEGQIEGSLRGEAGPESPT